MSIYSPITNIWPSGIADHHRPASMLSASLHLCFRSRRANSGLIESLLNNHLLERSDLCLISSHDAIGCGDTKQEEKRNQIFLLLTTTNNLYPKKKSRRRRRRRKGLAWFPSSTHVYEHWKATEREKNIDICIEYVYGLDTSTFKHETTNLHTHAHIERKQRERRRANAQ